MAAVQSCGASLWLHRLVLPGLVQLKFVSEILHNTMYSVSDTADRGVVLFLGDTLLACFGVSCWAPGAAYTAYHMGPFWGAELGSCPCR